MGKLYADLKSKGVADFERYLEDHPNLVEFAAATVPVTDVNRSAVQMMGGASVQDLIQPLGYLFEESPDSRSEEHTSELQSLMRSSYAVLCLKKKQRKTRQYRCKESTVPNKRIKTTTTKKQKSRYRRIKKSGREKEIFKRTRVQTIVYNIDRKSTNNRRYSRKKHIDTE